MDAIEAALDGRDNVRIDTYPPADHGFNCWARPSYRQQSAALAHGRSLAFFATHLGTARLTGDPMRRAHLDWPFFDDAHRDLAAALGRGRRRRCITWTTRRATRTTRARSVSFARLGEAGWLRHAVPRAFGGVRDELDSRALCIVRETLAYHDGLADFAFAMQGLGSGAIALGGDDALKGRYLPRVADGRAIAAFALSEPDAGSDVAAMTTRARVDGDDVVLDGCKTWISNGGIADFYTVFARTSDRAGARGIGAFVVDAGTPGLEVAERIDVIAPHPLATLRFTNCRVPATQALGPADEGFKLAMRTLDIFRASVAAAALGFARRAFDEAVRARARVACSATRWRTSSSRRPRSPTWRPTSTRPPSSPIAPRGNATCDGRTPRARPRWRS